jgi:hypothetical protein
MMNERHTIGVKRMTVQELYEFLRCELEKIDKKLEQMSTIQTRLTIIETQLKVLWVFLACIGVTTIGILLKSLLGLIIK